MRGEAPRRKGSKRPRLTFVEGMVLGAVIEAEGINAIGIAEARGLTVDEVTATLDELVRRGLIAEV